MAGATAVLVETVECKTGQVAVVRLNRPHVKNAINPALCRELARALDDIRHRRDVCAVVVTGSGVCFSAGVDLKDPVFADPSLVSREAQTGPQSYLWQLQQLRVPTIAAISGACITGGLEIALNCDVLLCDDTALFRDTHALYGIIPAGGMTQLLPRMIGLQAAKSMSLTGTAIAADRALQLGLVSEVLPQERLLPRAIELATASGGMDRSTLQRIKSLQHAGLGCSIEAALKMELDAAIESYEAMAHAPASTTGKLSSKFAARSKL